MNPRQGNHDHEHDLAAPYALDALTPEDQAAFEAHLASCGECQREVAELRQVVNVLPLACQLREPSPALRDRILTATAGEALAQPKIAQLVPPNREKMATTRHSRLWTGLSGLAAALLIVALGVRDVQLQQRVSDRESAIGQLQKVEAAIAAGAVVSPASGTPSAPFASAALVRQRGGGTAYMVVKGLPPIASNRVYQMWLLRGSTPQSAAIFRYSGRTPQVVQLTLPPQGYSAAAVTEEQGPEGSKAGPTGPIVLKGNLPA